MPNFTPALAKEYESDWADCEIDYHGELATQAAQKLLKNKARYLSVERATGVPWYWIAICHNREASGNFLGVLHNGEKIIGTGRKTKLVPAGRGPFNTWEEAAIDALKIKGLDKITEWNVGRFWYEVERFNGFGYRNKGVPSPYLWSHTNHYKDFSGDDDPGGGKYVADHVYNPEVHDPQLGAAAVLKALMALDNTIHIGQPSGQPSTPTVPVGTPKPVPTPTQTPKPLPGSKGGIGAVIAMLIGGGYYMFGNLIVLALLAGVGYFVWTQVRKKKEKKKTPKPDPVPTPAPAPEPTPAPAPEPAPVEEEAK